MNTSEMTPPVAPQQTSRRLVTDLLTGGGTTLLIGICFLPVARIFSPLAIPGFICVALGIGLLFAGCAVFPFSKHRALAR